MAEFFYNTTSKITDFLSLGTTKILNNIETIHSFICQTLQNSKINPKQHFVSLISFEEQLKTYSPFTLLFFGIFLIFFFRIMKKIIRIFKKIYLFFKDIKNNLIELYLMLPGPRAKLEKAKKDYKVQYDKIFKKSRYKSIEFRDNKQDYTKILAKLEQNLSYDLTNAKSGKFTGTIYCDDDHIHYIASEAARMFLYINLLHSDLFTYGRFVEAEVIKIGLDLFNGKEDSCGVTTDGGTMSILYAIYSYAKRGRSLGIKKPELIIPETAHAAFTKACDYFRIKRIQIPYNSKTYQVDLKKVEKNINKNTICIVGSFPNFPHTLYDDIESLSKIAVKYGVPLHVDCCLGGFLVAFHEKAGIMSTPVFDFRLPGVTSISADLHKYGLCPKGISLLLYSKHEYRKYAYFSYPQWDGGIYLTPGFEGSRSAGLIASSYAILTSLGRQYYAKMAKEIYDAVIKVKNFIKKECDLIEVIGDPCICGVSFTGEKCPYFYDLLHKKGYHTNYLYNPVGVGYIFTSANVKNVDTYIKDLREIHDKIKKGEIEPISEMTKIYGMAINYPGSVVSASLDVLADSMLD